MSFCDLCWRGFGVPANFSKHLTSPVHARGKCFQCNECALWFSTKGALGRHRKSLCEVPEIEDYHCTECRQDFTSPSGLRRHLRKTSIHAPTVGAEPAGRYLCQGCDRSFTSDRALTCHVESGVHTITQKIRCLSRYTCGKSFTTVSGMVYHLESGACTKQLNKERLLQEIMAKDTMNLITDKAQSPAPIVESSQLSTPPPSATTLGWPTEEGDEDAPPHFLLLSSILSQEEDAPYSTPLTSNPQFANTLTCPLCKGSRRRGRRRKFKSAAALQAHLDEMGAHLPEPYVYPGSKRRFITLGSLIRHAEDKVKEGGEEGRVAEEVVGCARGWLEGLCGERVRGWRDRAVYAGDNDDGGGDDGGAEDDGTEDEQEDGEDGGVIWGVSEGV